MGEGGEVAGIRVGDKPAEPGVRMTAAEARRRLRPGVWAYWENDSGWESIVDPTPKNVEDGETWMFCHELPAGGEE